MKKIFKLFMLFMTVLIVTSLSACANDSSASSDPDEPSKPIVKPEPEDFSFDDLFTEEEIDDLTESDEDFNLYNLPDGNYRFQSKYISNQLYNNTVDESFFNKHFNFLTEDEKYYFNDFITTEYHDGRTYYNLNLPTVTRNTHFRMIDFEYSCNPKSSSMVEDIIIKKIYQGTIIETADPVIKKFYSDFTWDGNTGYEKDIFNTANKDQNDGMVSGNKDEMLNAIRNINNKLSEDNCYWYIPGESQDDKKYCGEYTETDSEGKKMHLIVFIKSL